MHRFLFIFFSFVRSSVSIVQIEISCHLYLITNFWLLHVLIEYQNAVQSINDSAENVDRRLIIMMIILRNTFFSPVIFVFYFFWTSVIIVFLVKPDKYYLNMQCAIRRF